MVIRAAWLPRNIRNASGNGGGLLLGYMPIVCNFFPVAKWLFLLKKPELLSLGFRSRWPWWTKCKGDTWICSFQASSVPQSCKPSIFLTSTTLTQWRGYEMWRWSKSRVTSRYNNRVTRWGGGELFLCMPSIRPCKLSLSEMLGPQRSAARRDWKFWISDIWIHALGHSACISGADKDGQRKDFASLWFARYPGIYSTCHGLRVSNNITLKNVAFSLEFSLFWPIRC